MWQITDGTNTEALTVINAPTVDHAIAVEAYDTQAAIKVRGDRLAEAKPLEIEVGIHEASYGDALAKLQRVLNIAKTSGAKLQYVEGSETIERTLDGLASYEASRLYPDQGLIQVRLRLLPTGPYWSSSVRGNLVWVW